MSPSKQGPEAKIERALVAIRRDQQRRRLQRRQDPGTPGSDSLTDAAKFRYLDALESATEGLGISEIGELIGVDQPRASRLTRELLDAGLIRRYPDPRDGRRSVIDLRRPGREIVSAATRRRLNRVEAALAGFTPAEREHLAELLTRFVDQWPR